jgi:hypothetical protein
MKSLAFTRRCRHLLAAFTAVLLLWAWPAAAPGQIAGGTHLPAPQSVIDTPGPSPADSADLLREARNAQGLFERRRVQHSPWSRWSGAGPCDERVGRFCIRFGSDDPDDDRPSWTPPPDPPEVVEAREELLATLSRIAGQIPGDAWVAGQRVAYLAEVDEWEATLEAAALCEAEGWWCRGLQGFALHGLGRIEEAEAVFRQVLDDLPERERDRWEDPSLLTEIELYRELNRLDGEEEAKARDRVWTLSDPLFIVPGNAVWTEHMARRVLAEIRADARNGHGMGWADDMTQLLVRYGPVVAYERLLQPLHQIGPPPVLGRYDGTARHLVPLAEAVRSPSTSEPDHWRTDRRHARSRHAPPFAPRIHRLDADLTRFRRGDDLLLVASWEAPDEAVGGSALYLVDVADDAMTRYRFEAPFTGEAQGVGMGRVPAGGYLVSLEILDPEEREAWRTRAGVELPPVPRGVIALSDLLVMQTPETEGLSELEEGAEPDLTLEALVHREHSSLRLRPAPTEVIWEVYGLEDGTDRLRFELEAVEADRGLLRRAGEALRILSSPSPVRIGWEEGVDSAQLRNGAYLRRVVIDLTGRDSGTYELTLTLTPPGRTPTVVTRRIELVDEG